MKTLKVAPFGPKYYIVFHLKWGKVCSAYFVSFIGATDANFMQVDNVTINSSLSLFKGLSKFYV